MNEFRKDLIIILRKVGLDININTNITIIKFQNIINLKTEKIFPLQNTNQRNNYYINKISNQPLALTRNLVVIISRRVFELFSDRDIWL